MLRVVRGKNEVALDPGQVLPGRGAYVHLDPACIALATGRDGVAKTLKCKVPNDLLTRAVTKAPSVCDTPRGRKDS
jgi:predicted RNA-binding protein YlxR (DUF448 family)